MFNNGVFFLENHAVYEIKWKNIVEPGRPQMTIWHIGIAWCIPKTTNPHSEYVTFIAFPVQQWLHERPSLLRYTSLRVLTLRLLMSCMYGAPSKARNANVVYIWTYVWQR